MNRQCHTVVRCMHKQTRKCYKTNTRARSAAGYLPPSAITPAPSEDKLEQRLPEDSKHTKRALSGQTHAYGHRRRCKE